MGWWVDELNRWVDGLNRWDDGLMSWIGGLMSWWVESTIWWVDGLNRWVEMPKKHQTDPQSAQKRPQEEPKTTKKAIPNDKTKKGPNRDDLGTVLDRPRADFPSFRTLPGAHLGGQNGTKIDPKTIKNRSEKSRRKKPIQDDLGPVLGRSWAVLGAILGRLGPQNRALALGGARFFEKSLFRC